jgi:hypothetical protein
MHQNTPCIARRLALFCWALLYSGIGWAQDADSSGRSLINAFRYGQVTGKFRYFFSATINEGALSDYFANAAGGYLKYATRPFHGFQFVTGVSYTFNVWSSDMTARDSTTGMRSRYESTLFDQADAANRFNMSRLDELHLAFDLRTVLKDGVDEGRLTLGKQLVNTPFINEQDGRMRPTTVDAIWVNYRKNKWALEGGWIYGLSPRGSTNWFSLGHSIGFYGQGVNPNGDRANYRYNLNTDGVAVVALKYNSKRLNVAFWEQYIENVFNTLMLQPEYKLVRRNRTTLMLGTQLIRQDVVNDGGNPDSTKAYSFKLPAGTEE